LTVSSFDGMRRSKMRIIAEILRDAQKPAKKTHIMYDCSLSFNQLKCYLALLKNRALIQKKIDNGSVIYQTTNTGRKFLRDYFNITQLLRSPALKRP